MKMLIRVSLILISFMAETYAMDWYEVYHKYRDEFHKGYYSQILSNEFGAQQDISNKIKLSAIKDGPPSPIDFMKEPNINKLDYAGMAPIHYFAMTRIITVEDYRCLREIGNILISLGADINMPNKFGITPTNLAFAYGNFAAVESFIETKKLKVNTELLRELFSDKSDPKCYMYRENILYGRTKIWDAIATHWIPKEANLLTGIANCRITLLRACLESSPLEPSLCERRESDIVQRLRLLDCSLCAIADWAQHINNRKFQNAQNKLGFGAFNTKLSKNTSSQFNFHRDRNVLSSIIVPQGLGTPVRITNILRPMKCLTCEEWPN